MSAPIRDVLRACVATAEHPSPQAWARLGDSAEVLKHPQVQRAGLLPLLLHAAEICEVELDAALRGRLRAARLHAELRLEMMRPALTETLAAEDGVALRGVALAHTVYPHPALRHCHDLDLLTPQRTDVTVHPSAFPVSRHTSLFTSPRVGWDAVAATATTVDIAGVKTFALAPADALVHVCAHAAFRGRAQSPLWCIDAAMLLRSGAELAPFEETARRWGVERPAAHGLAYVRRLFG